MSTYRKCSVLIAKGANVGETTKIEWADHSWSPWFGCTRVSEECRHCYAEADNARFKRNGGTWGPGAPRIAAKDWKKPLTWNRAAMKASERQSVFPLLCDPFDDEVPLPLFARFMDLIQRTLWLDWLLLTKRPENVLPRLRSIELPSYDGGTWKSEDFSVWHNVRLGVSVGDQKTADKRREDSRAAGVQFVSYEPALGPVDWAGWEFVKQIISGGESGPGARPSHPDWHRATRDFCLMNRIAYFFKQWGTWAPLPPFRYSPAFGSGNREYNIALRAYAKQHGATILLDDRPEGWDATMLRDGCAITDGEIAIGRVGKKAAGRLLDGREWSQFPGEGERGEA